MAINIVFFGAPEFAVPCLRALADDPRFAISLVVTQPGRRAGRGRRIVEPAVKPAAAELGLDVWQPETLRTEETRQRLESLKPDLFVVVAFGEIFRRSILSIPIHECLNVHPSLLPNYRGSSPIPAAILNGDGTTGVSIIKMVRKLDAGPIVAQREVILNGDETAGELSRRLADVAAEMLPGVIHSWCSGSIIPAEQDEDAATFTRELSKDDGRIDWSRPAVVIERQIRAFSPWPSAWTTIDGKRLVIHVSDTWPEIPRAEPGELFVDNRHVLVACGEESLHLVQVQPEGKKSMRADDWWRGLRRDGQPRFDSPNAVPNDLGTT